jgi:cytochrome c553
MITVTRQAIVFHILLSSVAVCLALAIVSLAFAGDGAGEKKAREACAGCHGPAGRRPVTPETPRLAGQAFDYLVHALTEYRSGTRENAMMSAMAKPLTDQEIQDLARYYSAQSGLTTKQ